MDKRMIIGKVSGVHGIRGELKIKPLTDDANRFFDLKKITLFNHKQENDFIIENCRLHKNSVLLVLKDIDDRDKAKNLTGMTIAIDRSEAVPLAEDEYFIEDLKGISVYNENEYLGEITDVQQTAEIDVYIIAADEKIFCVPARKIYIKNIDLENERIDVNVPEEILNL